MKGSRHSRSFVGWLASPCGAMEPLINRRSLRLPVKAGIACIGAILGEDRVASWRPRGRSFVVGQAGSHSPLPGRFRLDRFAESWLRATSLKECTVAEKPDPARRQVDKLPRVH